MLVLLEALAARGGAHRHRTQSMEDNMPVAYSFEKGRSPAWALDFLLRRRCAFSAAAEIMLTLPWVETSRMPADGLSRER